jgi:signal transduction histidine kinase
MSSAVAEPNKWRKRLWRLIITSTLMGTSFAIGVVITAYIAMRLLFPIAAMGMMMGMVGMASAGAQATTNALYSGDSATRMAVLTQLQQTMNASPEMTFTDQTSAWILPAIEQCKTDVDSEVVSLAEEIATSIKGRTLSPPQ